MTRDTRIRELFTQDEFADHLGMRLVGTDPVVVEMPLTTRHHNFHQGTHGGAVFSVADCVFSLASNAAGRAAVAIDTHLVFTAPTEAGDVLTATAEEMTRGRTLATYRVVVQRGDGRTCGLFTGTVSISPDGTD